MEQVIRIGMDTSKRFFQLHGVDGHDRPVLRRQLTRAQVLRFFEKLPAMMVAMEACGAAHHWARELTKLGHEVRLIAPHKSPSPMWRGQERCGRMRRRCARRRAGRTCALCRRNRPIDRLRLMMASQRERLVRQRTQLANAIRGHAADIGLVAAKGLAAVKPLLERVAAAAIPDLARTLFAELAEEHAALCTRIAALDRRLRDWHAANGVARRLSGDPRLRPPDRLAHGDEDAGPTSVQVGAPLRRLARADAARPFDRRQGAARAITRAAIRCCAASSWWARLR